MLLLPSIYFVFECFGCEYSSFLHLHIKLLEVQDTVYQRMATCSDNDGQWLFTCLEQWS